MHHASVLLIHLLAKILLCLWPGEWLELLQSLLLFLEVPSSIVTGDSHKDADDKWPTLLLY